jgi:hypothetical protein
MRTLDQGPRMLGHIHYGHLPQTLNVNPLLWSVNADAGHVDRDRCILCPRDQII